MADILIRGMEMPKNDDDYVLCPKCGTAEHSPNRNFCHTCGAEMAK